MQEKTPRSPDRRLHIGGRVRAADWEVLDAIPGPAVDHVGDARDLSRFSDNTFSALYASHVAEHLDYKDQLLSTLKEWWRVLTPNGKIYLSVPDLDTLAHLFIAPYLSLEQRFMVMRMIFGGHTTPYDYHMTGLNQGFLSHYLMGAGFVDIQRIVDFGIFDDTSRMLFEGTPISCNLIAHKPGT